MKSDVWRPYEPSAARPWNARRVVHLHRRAAWGATWDEIERDVKEGPKAALDRLLQVPAEGQSKAHGPLSVDRENISRAALLEDLAIARESSELLRASWVTRLWHGSNPFGEQLTLMWHNHFATSHLKVRDVAAMLAQNHALRKLARAPFANLLRAMLHDRAMIVWLDNDANRKGHPNENLARELLELFTLGVGNYTERDVLETARALTGWTVVDGNMRFDSSLHDDGGKEILGERGRWDVDSVVQILVRQPAIAGRLAWRICNHFLAVDALPSGAIDDLAEQLRASNLDAGAAAATVVRSDLFFADEQIGRRIAPPASFIVSTARALELHERGLAPEVAGAWMRALGQDLFHPPGVGGWAGGRTWLGASSMIDRARFGLALDDGSLHDGAPRVDLAEFARQHGQGDPIDFAGTLLFAEPVNRGEPTTIADLLASTRAQFD